MCYDTVKDNGNVTPLMVTMCSYYKYFWAGFWRPQGKGVICRPPERGSLGTSQRGHLAYNDF